MLIYRRTSILESSAQTLVNTVNCVGVMGKGLAQAFRAREPQMYETYKRICDDGLLSPGRLWLWRGSNGWVLNFPTKKHWHNPSKLEWIEDGLAKFVTAYEEQGIREISFPRLGCGNGGLDWDDVRPIMETYLSQVKIPVFIHDYTVDIGLPEHLEEIARILQNEVNAAASFEGFLSSLRRAVDLTGEGLVELGSDRRFGAKMNTEDDLEIEASDSSWIFELDDLRSVWLGLQRGLVTSDRAAWPVGGGGAPLLTILSLLPHVRPVEIQKADCPDPEVAIELTPEMRRVATASQSMTQHELAWG